ncbi:hypothetical protein FACS189437_06040 [Bacteroidia bacterium]|nr:hypothetical protein FACS189437_06040 [Bacteroidia bacterium]
MKKMMFLMLTLMLLGAANVSAQVKIGGDGATGPVTGAVLELDGSQGALLLPRVDALTEIASPVAGMQVYLKSDNQVYIFDGTKWNVYAGPKGADGAKGATGSQGPAGPVNMKMISAVFTVSLAAGASGTYAVDGVQVTSVCTTHDAELATVTGVTESGRVRLKAAMPINGAMRVNCAVRV